MKDVVEKAAAAFLAGSDGMFEFMIESSYIVGRKIDGETLRLGRLIKRSPDTVERYAKGGLLYHAMSEVADTEVMREALDYQYWMAVAQIWSKGNVDLRGATMWLEHAIEKKWDYEKFYQMLPKPKNVDSEWQKTARRAADLIDDLVNSPAFGIDEVKYKAGLRLLKMASSWLKGMTMSNIVEELVKNGIATNNFQAANIANGLKLAELKTDEERIVRARLYRDHRNSGEDSKTSFEKAIAGEKVPALLPYTLHSIDPDFSTEIDGDIAVAL